MRVLWISFLLVGSITCVPQSGTYQGPYFSGGYQPAGQSGFGSSGYSSVQPAGGDTSFSSVSQQDGQRGSAGVHHQSAQGSWHSSDDNDEEPSFTPVSPEDQVYAHKSRAQYKKHRMMFSQFVYIPTESVDPQGPVFPHHDTPSQQSKGQVHKGY